MSQNLLLKPPSFRLEFDKQNLERLDTMKLFSIQESNTKYSHSQSPAIFM